MFDIIREQSRNHPVVLCAKQIRWLSAKTCNSINVLLTAWFLDPTKSGKSSNDWNQWIPWCSQPECFFLRGIHVIFWVFQRGTGVCPGSLCRRLHGGLSQELQWLGLCDHKFFERVKIHLCFIVLYLGISANIIWLSTCWPPTLISATQVAKSCQLITLVWWNILNRLWHAGRTRNSFK